MFYRLRRRGLPLSTSSQLKHCFDINLQRFGSRGGLFRIRGVAMATVAAVPRLTIAQRENLIPDCVPDLTGFTPRRMQQLATRRPPRSIVNIECNHYLRSSAEEGSHGLPPLGYQLWLEAGKHSPPIPERPQSNYNSNVWRNFREEYGIRLDTEGQNMSELVASMYPLNIPAPSSLGKYTYANLLRETDFVRDQVLKRKIFQTTTRDVRDFKWLRMKSDARNPPMDTKGNIEPPRNFKKYKTRFVPPPTPEGSPSQSDARLQVTWNRILPNKPRPHLWKLSYKLNTPQYEQVQDEIRMRKNFARRRHPRVTTNRVQ